MQIYTHGFKKLETYEWTNESFGKKYLCIHGIWITKYRETEKSQQEKRIEIL